MDLFQLLAECSDEVLVIAIPTREVCARHAPTVIRILVRGIAASLSHR